jgi:hypothetical protein
MNFFDHKDLGNHLLQLCPKVVKHPVCMYVYIYIYIYIHVVDAKGLETMASQTKAGCRVFQIYLGRWSVSNI